MAAEVEDRATSCPHCVAGEPSVWDDVLFHYAHPHPAGDKLKMCHDPWRERCRRCSANPGACTCGATSSQSSMRPADAFHAHLDVCAQCADHPFQLCRVGAALLVATAQDPTIATVPR